MTEDNKDQLSAKDLLVAYFDVDYKRNPKGSNYWRNRWVGVGGWVGALCHHSSTFIPKCC